MPASATSSLVHRLVPVQVTLAYSAACAALPCSHLFVPFHPMYTRLFTLCLTCWLQAEGVALLWFCTSYGMVITANMRSRVSACYLPALELRTASAWGPILLPCAGQGEAF
jgi:hypothetical protein